MMTLKASHMVKPAGKTPSGIMYVSECDQFMPITHAPLIYFYKSPAATNLSLTSITKLLKDSLSKALSIFYPFAGRLQSASPGRLELNLNSAGALLLAADSGARVDDFGDFCPTPEVRKLIPSVDYSRPIHELPLLLVQITKFDCGGVSLGLGVSHIVVDGQATAHFVSEWARIARGEQPETLPFLDRTVLKPGEALPAPVFDGSDFGWLPVLVAGPDPAAERRKETTVVMLKLRKDQIEMLRKKANEDRKAGDPGPPFTRYEALAAHMWRCMCRARRHSAEQLTKLRVPVDFRRHMEPPLPNKYFGNAIVIALPTTTAGELLSQPLGRAVEKVRAAIERVMDDQYVRSFIAYMSNEEDLNKFRHSHIVGTTQGAFYGNPNLTITSWMSLPLHGADFGWGVEIHMGAGAVGFDGKSFIVPCHGDEEGSLMVALRLQTAHMDDFRTFFYEDLSTMSKL